MDVAEQQCWRWTGPGLDKIVMLHCLLGASLCLCLSAANAAPWQ